MSATAAIRSEEPIVQGDFPFTQRDFRRIASILREESGIHLAEAKVALVYSRLAKRLRKTGIASFAEYCDIIESRDGAEERMAMLAALTTNVTRFFREPHHFDHLRERTLPPLIAAARTGKRVRLWSSACSTGEEPYSIALTLLSMMPDAAQYDVRLLATDIDPNVVTTAKAGVYSSSAIEPIPAAMRDRWLSRSGDKWRVNDEVRALIAFNTLNLIGDWPMRGRFDIIFCRNVVIYFESETQDLIWTRFRNILSPEGRVYIGHSERIDDNAFVSDGLTIYRLNGARA